MPKVAYGLSTGV